MAAAEQGRAQAGVILPLLPGECRSALPHAAVVLGANPVIVLARERSQLDAANDVIIRCAGFYARVKARLEGSSMELAWLFSPAAKLAIAGARGGVVRWLTLKQPPLDGAISVIVGAICASISAPASSRSCGRSSTSPVSTRTQQPDLAASSSASVASW